MVSKYAGNDYEVGKGKPPRDFKFKKGQSGNPGGKTSKQRKLEVKNAETATVIRERLLSAVNEAISGASVEEVIARIDAALLTLLKDSENRGLGLPRAAMEHTSPDGTMTPTVVRIVGPEDDA